MKFRESTYILIIRIVNVGMVVFGLYIVLFTPNFITYPDRRIPGVLLIFFGISYLMTNFLSQKLKLLQKYSRDLIYFFQILVVTALFSSTIGFLGLFIGFKNYDSFTHFLIPLTLTFILFIIFLAQREDYKLQFSLILTIIILMFGLVLFWELFEYTKDKILHESLWLTNGDPNDFRDDLIADALGIGTGTLFSNFFVGSILEKFKNNKNSNG